MPVEKATIKDVPELIHLINNAYRGEHSRKGWTSEADIFDGERISQEMLEELFKHTSATILKYTSESNTITGTVYLEIRKNALYLGMLTVSPELQGKGIGKILLEEGEVFAKQNNCQKITMSVIKNRKELIAWYERHGYQFTGEILPFYDDGRFGKPKQPITLMVLAKDI
ncbi:GNAT family N-acetyltransferase [Chitinophaga pendula]|uniref:GNAT family N-acetyltransferase n=1 Tax=Chitinophaga TaxID=79328 RepID=UPI000BB08D5E|nr:MULTISPECIES: N-acetyltransferase [Chitinophaga]ASZ12606.1 GNAT family N-acetyltransferase [Chitinophaga sp. MD30]UCJ09790.1 GNAT family N-acetyltransferase [Chitinophaga pendula]